MVVLPTFLTNWYPLPSPQSFPFPSNYYVQKLSLIFLQITSFGYTSQQSLLYGVPGGAVEVVALLVNGYTSHITQQRILCSTGGLLAGIVGMILIVALPLSNNVGRLIGYYMTQASPTPFVALLSLVSSNVAGYTKKTTVAALYLIGYCAGNIIGMSSFLACYVERRGGRLRIMTRAPSIPPQRRSPLRPCRNHDYRLLGCLPHSPAFNLVVVQETE